MSLVEGKYLEVNILGENIEVQIAQTESEMMEAKALDDLVFSAHLGITTEELVEIMNHGRLLLLRDSDGKLIGESQVITSPIPQHPHLESDEAYNYGTAVLPEKQNGGVAQVLFKAQEMVALEAGKKRSTLTVRLENAQSVSARFKAGFQVVGYDAQKYGPMEKDGARLIMEKNLLNPRLNPSREVLNAEVSSGNIKLVNEENIEGLLEIAPSQLGVVVQGGDMVDLKAHALVDRIFKNSQYKGIGYLKPNSTEGEEEKLGLFVLKNLTYQK